MSNQDAHDLIPNTRYPRIVPAGDGAALIELGDEMSAEMSLRVQSLAKAMGEASVPGIEDLLPAYSTLLVHFDPTIASIETVVQVANAALSTNGASHEQQSRVRQIPTLYGGEHGPDLPTVASRLGLSETEVVRRHSEAEYLVCFLGFAPGHPYVVGLPPELSMPRRPTPREQVPGGAVTIANQTNVYGVANPTGWWWIGRTPLKMFDPRAESPTFLLPGDRLRFVPISEQEYINLSARE